MVEALESYSSHLESSFIKVPLPPSSSDGSIPPSFDLSPSYVAKLDNEFVRVHEEYYKRVTFIQTIAEEIIKLWAELGTPQAQTDTAIIENWRESPEQLGLHEDDLNRLKAKKAKLVEEKRSRERRVKELRSTVEGLWVRLGVEERDQKAFLAANRGCGLRVINEYEDELARLNELKRQNLHLFVEDARCKLQELWDALYFSEEEMLDFTPAFSDVYSDALLSAHEGEIARLQTLKEQREPTLQLIEKYRSIINDRETLAASSQDASRLLGRGQKGEKRDPTRLLREEKMRKRIAKDLPKVEADLRKTLEAWEDEYGRPFLVHGQRYVDELNASCTKAPPPRSKTPNGLPPPRSKTPSAPPPSSAKSSMSRPPTQQGFNSSSMRPPPPRSKTPSSTATVRGNPSARSTNGPKSPSKIPSRVPLGNMPHGGNSPERKMYDPNAANNTIRKMGPPRVPPPKMRDIFSPPGDQSSASNYSQESSRAPSVISSSSSVVRQISPEDVYEDGERGSYMQASHQFNHREDTPQTYQDLQQQAHNSYYGRAPNPSGSSRQISETSTTNTGASGSENWETYDDNSEPEPEADSSDAYYARLRAARGKRFTPEGGSGYMPQGKKMKGIRGVGGTVVEEQYPGGQHGRVDGSDAAWTEATDEEAF